MMKTLLLFALALSCAACTETGTEKTIDKIISTDNWNAKDSIDFEADGTCLDDDGVDNDRYFVIRLSDDAPFTIENSASWCSAVELDGRQLALSVEGNTTGTDRSCTITIRRENAELSLAVTQAAILAAPTALEFTNASLNSISLSWNTVSQADLYWVYACKGEWDPAEAEFIDETTETHFLHTGLDENTAYSYAVQALDSDESTLSSFSTPARFMTSKNVAPTGLKVAELTSTSVSLTWDEDPAAIAYRVYVDGTHYERATTNSCTVGGLTPDTKYVFYVVSVFMEQLSDHSLSVSAQTEP